MLILLHMLAWQVFSKGKGQWDFDQKRLKQNLATSEVIKGLPQDHNDTNVFKIS